MKLIAKDAALVTVIIEPDEVRPLNGIYLPALFRRIAERYELVQIPTLDEAAQTGAKFGSGRFMTSTGIAIPVRELAVFNDGYSVMATDTSDAELVLDDLMTWLKESFGFREPITKNLRLFQSDLIVDLDNDPQKLLKSLSPLLSFIAESMGLASKTPFYRMAFACDPAETAGATTEFGFERRRGAPWSLNRFFCKAHMQTANHIRALDMFDSLLSKR